MKRAWILLVLLLISGVALGQLSATASNRPGVYVGTESVQNVYKNVTGTASIDTTASIAFLVGVMFNKPVASDTITITDGSTAVASFAWGETAPAIFYATYNCKISDTLFTERKATSDITLIYRVAY